MSEARLVTGKQEQHRSKRVEVNGWVVLDKPIGITSTHAVSRLKQSRSAFTTASEWPAVFMPARSTR